MNANICSLLPFSICVTLLSGGSTSSTNTDVPKLTMAGMGPATAYVTAVVAPVLARFLNLIDSQLVKNKAHMNTNKYFIYLTYNKKELDLKKHNKGFNYDTDERISDFSPDEIPDEDKDNNVNDSNYVDELYSDNQLERHATEGKNVFTVDGIPSRFDHNRERSTYHFDAMRDTTDDPDDFKILCTFKGDWGKGLEMAFNEGREQTIGNYRPRGQSQQDVELSDGEMMDVKRASGKEDVSCMYQVILRNMDNQQTMNNGGNPVWNDRQEEEYKPFFNMVEALGIEAHQTRLHIQLLGQVTPMHIDQQMRYARPQWRKVWKEGGGDKDPLKLRRILIMLNDWEYGHAWQFGNTMYSGYHAGEAVCYDWCNMPHGTANFGYKPRFTLQITGFITDKTIELMKNGSSNHIIQV